MALRRPSHLDVPPAASSSVEEGETSSEGQEEEEEDDEDEASQDMKPQPTPKPSTSSKKTDHSDSDDESSSESEPADSPVKPIASKPMENKKGTSNSSVLATPEKKSAAKRPRETEDSKKRAKKKKSSSEALLSDAEEEQEEEQEEEPKKSGGGDDSKKLFQRLWSEDDEIVILNGMIEYASKKGTGPASDMNAFYDYIKKSLQAEGSRAQLVDKTRRLKKKYGNNAKRNKYNPTKPHEQKVFELSKKIWGSGGGEERKSNGVTMAAKSTQKSNRKALLASPAVLKEGSRKAAIDGKASVLESADEMTEFGGKHVLKKGLDLIPESKKAELDEKWKRLHIEMAEFGIECLPKHVLKKGLELIPESKKAELDEKWKKLHIDELELFAKKHKLISDEVMLVLEKLKSSDR